MLGHVAVTQTCLCVYASKCSSTPTAMPIHSKTQNKAKRAIQHLNSDVQAKNTRNAHLLRSFCTVRSRSPSAFVVIQSAESWWLWSSMCGEFADFVLMPVLYIHTCVLHVVWSVVNASMHAYRSARYSACDRSLFDLCEDYAPILVVMS